MLHVSLPTVSKKQWVHSNIHHTFSSPYYPPSNGRVERNNQSVLSLLRCVALDNPENWPKFLPSVTNSLNNCISSTTKTCANVIIFGKMTSSIYDIELPETNPISQHVTDLINIQQYASDKNYHCRNQYNLKDESTHNEKVTQSELKPGNIVYWQKPQLDPNLSYKLQKRAHGPFITLSVNNNCAKLKHAITNKILNNNISLTQLVFPRSHSHNQ